MIHDRRRPTSVDERRLDAPSSLVRSSDRRMIDLRAYLRQLDKPTAGRVVPGDRRRVTTNVRTAATSETGGRSEAGRWPCLVGRRDRGADAVLVRARLSSYQRALSSARKTLRNPHPALAFHPGGASLFTTNSDGGADRGSLAEQGGDQ